MNDEAYRLMSEQENSHWWYRARRSIIVDLVRSSVPPGSSVLDFGCGNGATAARLVSAGYRVSTCDSSEFARDECRGRGLEVIEESDLAPESFDLLLVCDVLEHVEDDFRLFRRLSETLRPGGIALVTVPAHEFLWSGEDYVSRHVRRYSRERFMELIATLDPVGARVNYFNSLLSPLAVASILGNRWFRPASRFESNVKPLPRSLDRLLGGIFALERGLIRRLPLPFGISLIAIARKPVPHSTESA